MAGLAFFAQFGLKTTIIVLLLDSVAYLKCYCNHVILTNNFGDCRVDIISITFLKGTLCSFMCTTL